MKYLFRNLKSYISEDRNPIEERNGIESVQMKEHLKNIEISIENKRKAIENIQSGIGGYYDTAIIPTKKKTSIIGINGHPIYGHYQEITVNWDRVNGAINSVNSSIGHYLTLAQAELEVIRTNAKNFNENFKLKKDNLSKSYDETIRKFSSCSSDYNFILRINNDLKHKLDNENSQFAHASSLLYQTKNRITGLDQQIKLKVNLHNEQQIELMQLKSETLNKIEALSTQLKQAEEEINKTLLKINSQERAILLIDLWKEKDEDSRKIIHIITKLEFDANHENLHGISLLKLAILENDRILFNLILNKNPSLDLELGKINNKTFLQYAIEKNYHELVEKMLQVVGCNYTKTLLFSFKQNDLTTIDLLFTKYPELAGSVMQGYSMLQLAIMDNKLEIIDRILAVNPNLVNFVNFKKETPLNIALKLKNSEIIQLLIKKLDSNAIITSLIKSDENDQLETLLETIPSLIDQIDQSVLYQAICENKTDLARILINQGISIDQALKLSLEQSNHAVFAAIHNIDKDAFIGSKLDKHLLLKAATCFSEPDIINELQEAINLELLGNNSI